MRLLIALLVLIAPCGWAEEAGTFRYRANGHGYFSVGGCQHRYAHYGAGFGGEGFVWKGLAVGGNLDFIRFDDWVGASIGLGDVQAGYHFVNRSRPVKVDPFVNPVIVGAAFNFGGHSMCRGVGGGVNYWFKPRIALRLEGRVIGLAAGEALYMARLGVTFR